MTDPQPSLFDPIPRRTRAIARRSDPGTSHAAAASIAELRPSQDAVLRLLRTVGPSTDERIADQYCYREATMLFPRQSPSGLRTRRRELVDAGLVYDTGHRDVTVSGRQAIVWAARAENSRGVA